MGNNRRQQEAVEGNGRLVFCTSPLYSLPCQVLLS